MRDGSDKFAGAAELGDKGISLSDASPKRVTRWPAWRVCLIRRSYTVQLKHHYGIVCCVCKIRRYRYRQAKRLEQQMSGLARASEGQTMGRRLACLTWQSIAWLNESTTESSLASCSSKSWKVETR
ncbi:hypothetical protein VTO42DRAFT_1725 [Malbranchea cinnamomea]